MQLTATPRQDYLQASEIIDWQHPRILAQSRALVDGLTQEAEQVQTLFEWVRDAIPHSKDIAAEVVTCSASEVLRYGTGICYAKSHLLAAMLRAIGIPAGFCYQVLRKDPPYEGTVLHGLNGVFMRTINRWIRLDPRGNVDGIDAQFSLTQERLAFSADPAQGEYLYEDIFAAPAPVVVDVLRRFTSCSSMWPYLPTDLHNLKAPHPSPLPVREGED
jgi:transglutaminase-like putative cysteine protease